MKFNVILGKSIVKSKITWTVLIGLMRLSSRHELPNQRQIRFLHLAPLTLQQARFLTSPVVVYK